MTKHVDNPQPTRVAPGLIAVVKSSTSSDRAYELTVAKDSHSIYCSCPAWKFSKPGVKSCKHVRKFLEENLGVAAALQNWELYLEKEIFGEVKTVG